MADNVIKTETNSLIHITDQAHPSTETCSEINHLESALGLVTLTPIQAFFANPCEDTFKEIPKKNQTSEMAFLAVQSDPWSFKYVSKKWITPELCKVAVSVKGNILYKIPEDMRTKDLCVLALQKGAHLDDVPRKLWTKKLCLIAIRANGYNIEYIPKSFQNREMAMAAVEHNVTIRPWTCQESYYPIHFIAKQLITSDLVNHSIMTVPLSIKDVPADMRTKELCHLAVSLNYKALEYIPLKFKTKGLCLEALGSNPGAYKYIPPKYASKDVAMKLINSFLEERPIDETSLFYCLDLESLLRWIPYEILNESDVFELLLNKVSISILSRFADMFTESNNQIIAHKSDSSLAINSTCLFSTQKTMLINENDENYSLPAIKTKKTIHFLANEELSTNRVYYITDIHIEHQLPKDDSKGYIEKDELDDFLDKRIKAMIPKDISDADILLIGGDVAHTKILAERFYSLLRFYWPGTILAILGNHELWDDIVDLGFPNPRTVDDIVKEYEDIINSYDPGPGVYKNTQVYYRHKYESVLLHNSVFILYKGTTPCVITEEQIMNSSTEDLREVLLKSSVIVFGGTGFSGLNPHFNSTHGIYRSTISTLEEDLNQTCRFKGVYGKLMSAADDLQIIVFSHNPFSDWCSEPYNPKWVYMNGHTHRNTMILEKSGLTVLSDNQVGYKPSKWKLAALAIKGFYDPFGSFADGIHIISSEQYKDFNNGRGIANKGCSYDGTIYCLKKGNLYMFLLLNNNSLCLLDGGRRKGLAKGKRNINIQYYYDNMDLYAHILQAVIKPYQTLLEEVSDEVKKFGGDGTIHGCIVDIDFYNHIYVNPRDFKKTPYFAYDIMGRTVYGSVDQLLQEKIPKLANRYKKQESKGNLPLLSDVSNTNGDTSQLSFIPEYVFGTDIYDPSRKMRSLQYLLDNNVIRIWDDSVLQHNMLSPETIKEIESEVSDT